jgi:hypothetical protein
MGKVVVIAGLLVAGLSSVAQAQSDEPGIGELMPKWRKQTWARIEKDPRMKQLAKHSLVVVHSRMKYAVGGAYGESAFSFNYESSNPAAHKNDVQLLFEGERAFRVNMVVGQQNMVMDLGAVDFEKSPDPSTISIDDKEVFATEARAIEGHVYLLRIRDERGNSFYVLLQLVTMDEQSRYMAFVWRRLPGGRVVRFEE